MLDGRSRSIPGMRALAVRAMLAGLVLVGLIGIIDLVTGPDFGFAFFYFIPIVPVAWSAGRWPGIVVAVSASATPPERERALRAGCDDFLPKPYYPEQMREMIHKHLPPHATRGTAR